MVRKSSMPPLVFLFPGSFYSPRQKMGAIPRPERFARDHPCVGAQHQKMRGALRADGLSPGPRFNFELRNSPGMTVRTSNIGHFSCL
ncbi:hypothetical protein [Methylovirgula ligni]|uniref:hypothetical protein n=1 Tax=Methylovirgula ligni TaxID=569860 RepID=UPI001011FDC8|nr:hypothetical protein [Methylovirgula ligni]